MKVVFLGTPELAACALKALIASRHEVLAVITQPDKASGRGMTTKFSPVKQVAVDAGIPVLQPASIRAGDLSDEIRELGADLFIVAAFSQLLPKWFLELPPKGCINIDPSLLPKYRGASPLRGPIINGDETFGVTIMKMVEKLDAGDILLQKEFPMGEKETILTLTPKAAEIGAEMLIEVLDAMEEREIVPVPQDDEKSSYIKQLEKEDGRILFSNPAAEIERQIRACDPWPSAFTTISKKIFKIWDADVVEETESAGGEKPVCGSVAFVDKKTLLVQTGKDLLKLNIVQLEGKKRMTIEEFLRGKKLEKGFVFGE